MNGRAAGKSGTPWYLQSLCVLSTHAYVWSTGAVVLQHGSGRGGVAQHMSALSFRACVCCMPHERLDCLHAAVALFSVSARVVVVVSAGSCLSVMQQYQSSGVSKG